MKLLLLLTLIGFVLGDEGFVPENIAESNDVAQDTNAELQSRSNAQDGLGEKKLGKRSYGWSPWTLSLGHGWPWYGLGGHGWSGGWPTVGWPSTGWPVLHAGHGHGGYVGIRAWPSFGGWHKGW